MCSPMLVCVLLPRFALAVAAGGREGLAAGPVALAPEPGREPVIGEASAAAEAYGVRAGLRIGEALARCPTLRLVPPDPAGVADEWDQVLVALEGMGAAVESERPGMAFFDATGLWNLHGGLDGVLAAARRALRGAPIRIGAAPSRFAALAAATRARARRAEIAPGGGPFAGSGRGSGRLGAGSGPLGAGSGPLRTGSGPLGAGSGPLGAGGRLRSGRRGAVAGGRALAKYLAPFPVTLLATREETAALPDPLERFGIRSLGELAALPRAALADRFGEAGPLARDLARGRDTPLVPRRAAERLEEVLELPESGSGTQLEHALGLLIDRVLARRERRGRSLRAVVLSAALVEGGTWRIRMTFREALSDPRRMRLALVPRLAELPAPADVLRLRVEGFGPPAGTQRSLLSEPAAIRSARLREAVRQARAVAGPDAALRIIPIDPDSRVPERRLALAPWDP
jgi:protein ImuB